MYTLQLKNGDIAISGDGSIKTVSGIDRIKQELECWILEPLNSDPLYGGFGSDLGDYIGSPMLDRYVLDVRAEVVRVLDNYIVYQQKYMEKTPASSWNDDDVINTINSVDVSTVNDTINVSVRITTVAGKTATIVGTV